MSASLISRLEAATGPDRELDADIWLSGKSMEKQLQCSVLSGGAEIEERCTEDAITWRTIHATPAYTGSLDAQKPLAHPDWQVSSGNCNEDNGPWACVTTPDAVDHTGDGAATEELARLIALLKARGIGSGE